MTNAEVTATESAPSTIVQVKVKVDIDSAFIRGQIVAPTALIDVDIATLSVAARKALLDGGRAGGPFELKDPEYHRPHAAIDEPTTEKIVAILEIKGANLEKERLQREATRQKRELEEQQELERFLAASPERGTISIFRNLRVLPHTGYGTQDYFTTEGWLTGCFTEKYRVYSSLEVTAHVNKYEKENAALAQSLSVEIENFYLELDSKKEAQQASLAAEKAASIEAEKAVEAEKSKARLKSSEYAEDFCGYDANRYGEPWGAILGLDENNRSLKWDYIEGAFDGEHGEEGTVTLPCKPGDVIAVGQVDRRGNDDEKRIMLMEEDGSMRALTKSEATKHLRAQAKA